MELTITALFCELLEAVNVVFGDCVVEVVGACVVVDIWVGGGGCRIDVLNVFRLAIKLDSSVVVVVGIGMNVWLPTRVYHISYLR